MKAALENWGFFKRESTFIISKTINRGRTTTIISIEENNCITSMIGTEDLPEIAL